MANGISIAAAAAFTAPAAGGGDTAYAPDTDANSTTAATGDDNVNGGNDRNNFCFKEYSLNFRRSSPYHIYLLSILFLEVFLYFLFILLILLLLLFFSCLNFSSND